MTSVIPYMEELKRMNLKGKAGGLIELIDRNLKKLTEPFAAKISSPLLKLSPIEQKVAHFIRDGKTNKEIAALLNVSKSTILTHRHHIRAKLGLKHQKINLRSYLSAQ
jgi:DNA-binding NarL/FixJ family response regulator